MYTKLKPDFTKQELDEYFTLSNDDLNIINNIRRKNRLGFAVFLKAYQYLCYYPLNKSNIPYNLIKHISNRLNEPIVCWKNYRWKSITWKRHLDTIRKYTGFKPFDSSFYPFFTNYLINEVPNNLTRMELSIVGISKFRKQKVELPSEEKFRRLINSSRKIYFDSLYKEVTDSLNSLKKSDIDRLFIDKENSDFDWLKSNAGILGVNTILDEINKVKYISKLRIEEDIISNMTPKLRDKLYKRVRSYDKYRMRGIKDKIRYTLFSVFLYVREKELLDSIVNTFLDLIKRMDNKSENAIEKQVVKEIKKVYGKQKILRNLTLAITENPQGNISDVILTKVDLGTLNKLKEEFLSSDEVDYHSIKAKNLKSRYAQHYRQMMKPILDLLDFKTNNSTWRPILEALELIKKYIDTRHKYYPEDEDVPFELISDKWKGVTIEKTKKGILRVRKHFFELCVLEKLSKLIKCKEIYVEKSLKYRNPVDDLPKDWEDHREEHYKKINAPLNKNEFINPVKDSLISFLGKADTYFSTKKEVFIFHTKNVDRGFFRVPRLRKQEESCIVTEIKDIVTDEYKTIDLLDILIEADRHINFSKFFSTSAQRQILSEDEIRERLLLNMFSLGTNIELKRIYNSASPNCSYKDLLYFRKRYMNPDALRNSTIALTNMILEIRNPDIWGESKTCACDAKQFTSYEQNLMASSNPHYPNKGIMVYWHVDKNSTCIYSQLKHTNSSEVVSMIEGLIKHETEMKIEGSYTDSRGQSEIAFAFCHFLGIDLMPRFSKVKYKKLYIPDKNKDIYPNLKSVIEKPINWKLIETQYDEMVKHVVAIVNGSGSTESILRRFSSYNNTHPTYKAFKELGRAKKTIFLCNYLTDPKLRREIHKALNIVEAWNAVNSFISYGNRYEFNTNDPIIQEMTVLSLHLLQNALILVNTVLLDKVITNHNFLDKMTEMELSSLTPLFTSNINPYGTFNLDLNKKSILEAA